MINNQVLFSRRWETVHLGSVVNFLDSRRKPITQKDRIPGPYPYYGANGQQDSVADYLFDEPLVLLAEDGGHFGDPDKAIAYQVEGKCWVNNHAHVLRPKDCIDIRYLCRHLERYDVTPFVTGTTRGKLTKGAASRIPILLPPIAEQKRIAAILDKADAVRRKRDCAPRTGIANRAIRLTEELLRLRSAHRHCQSAFLEMFGDPVTHPKGWEVKTLGEVSTRVTVGYVSSMASEYVEDGIPWLRSLNISRNRIVFDNIKYVSREFHNKLNKSSLSPGDVVSVRTGNAGVTAVIPDSLVEANCSDLIVITCGKSILPKFLAEALNMLLGDRDGGSDLTGAIQKHLNITRAKTLLIPIPPIQEQKKWTEVNHQIESMQSKLVDSEEESAKLFNSLLQRAFRGEL